MTPHCDLWVISESLGDVVISGWSHNLWVISLCPIDLAVSGWCRDLCVISWSDRDRRLGSRSQLRYVLYYAILLVLTLFFTSTPIISLSRTFKYTRLSFYSPIRSFCVLNWRWQSVRSQAQFNDLISWFLCHTLRTFVGSFIRGIKRSLAYLLPWLGWYNQANQPSSPPTQKEAATYVYI